MSVETAIYRLTDFPGKPQTLMVRAYIRSGTNRTLLLQAGTESITVTVFDSGTQISTPLTPAVSDAVFNTLQTGDIWSEDTTGFNVMVTLPGTYTPNGNRIYIAYLDIELTGGETFTAAEYRITTLRAKGTC